MLIVPKYAEDQNNSSRIIMFGNARAVEYIVCISTLCTPVIDYGCIANRHKSCNGYW